MKTYDIYDIAIEMGIDSDPRGRKTVEKNLQRVNEKYKKLDDKEKNYFDLEKLTNPYSDTRIHFDNNIEVKKVLVGIDIDGAEMLLADKLGDIDLVIAHHPMGKASANFADVMNMQTEILANHGVPINVAEKIMKKRIDEVDRKEAPVNHYATTNMAKLLNIPLMNIHTPCDNLVSDFLKQKIEEKNPEYVEDVLEILNSIPEYQEGKKQGSRPRLFCGSGNNYAGKTIIEMTGGTEGSKDICEKLAQAGIGTTINMHASEKYKEEIDKSYINMVIAGHISSDSIGINLLCDVLETQGITIVPCSGFIRIKRE